jgi:RNA polymerase sigma-54 factor
LEFILTIEYFPVILPEFYRYQISILSSMLKQGLNQKLLQKLSPQQIQFIKLLQVPTIDMERRIKEELEENPALEEEENKNLVSTESYSGIGENQNSTSTSEEAEQRKEEDSNSGSDENLDEYFGSDDSYDNTGRLPYSSDEEDRYEAPVIQLSSLMDSLDAQLGMMNLDELEQEVGHHLIGSLDDNGYLTRSLEAIQDDLAFRRNIEVGIDVLEKVLHSIQRMEPAGVGARDLRECLMVQIRRKEPTPEIQLALKILTDHFDEFSKRHFDKLTKRLHISESQLKSVIQLISRLNPKPGESQSQDKTTYIVPDFLLMVNQGEIDIKLNSRNAPELRVSKSYREMLKEYAEKQKKTNASSEYKEAVQFMKARIDNAQWFIDAVRQRQVTLLKTMVSIASRQKAFFISEGDDRTLRPMILKDVADEVQMDISTISRVANSKFVQTEFGIYPLKYFFSEGVTTESGEEVSNKQIKKILSNMIEAEDKRNPLSDEQLKELLNDEGFPIARRTVVKYRQEMEIPVARLRKQL